MSVARALCPTRRLESGLECRAGSVCNIGEAFSFSGPNTLNVNQPAFVQDFPGLGRNLPLRQTPDSAPRLKGWLLAAPRVLLATHLAPLRLDAAISIFFKASGSTHRF